MVDQPVRVEMSLTDFIEHYHQQPFELVRGEVIALSPNVAGHQWVAQKLFLPLSQHVNTNNLGYVAFETPFVLKDDSDWVKGSRTPDLAFYSAERWQAYIEATPDWKRKPHILVPDLAIEIVSPNDLYTEIQDKVDGYLDDGVQLVWVIDPQRKKVIISTGDSDVQITIRYDGILTGGDVLPGFQIALKSLFDED